MEIIEDNMSIDVDTKTRKYHKELKLPENLDHESVKANYKNGVLDITIKRKKEKPKKGKKIKIS
jgi:HSP20 family protein